MGAGVSFWAGLDWSPHGWRVLSFLAAGGFGITAAALLALALRPAVQIHETHLRLGRREIPWTEIRRLDRTRWVVPLAVWITLESEQRFLLIYAGDVDSSTSLLHRLRRNSRRALLDGIPHRHFWGQEDSPPRPHGPLERYPLLAPEEEQEVEKMFQRLKTAGRLEGDAKGHPREDRKASGEKIG